jgi:GT2 family glycosyltransferase
VNFSSQASRTRDIAVSVVIPTYNRLPRLRRVLQALQAQTGVDEEFVEVVVVSDGSSDGTSEYLSSGRTPLPVNFAQQANRGPAAARNRGIEMARGRLVLFVDDDVVPRPRLVAEHLAAHRREGPATVVLGPMLTPDDHAMSPWVAYEQAMLYKQYRAMENGDWQPTARQFFTGNASLARRHLVAAGGFDEHFARAEDVELAYRLAERGLRFVFVPAAAGLHYAERSYAAWCNTAYAYGRNDAVFASERGQQWLLPTVSRELEHHHPLNRLLARSTLASPRFGRVAGRCLDGAVRAMTATRTGPPRVALSAVFNVGYYRGLADGLRAQSSDRPADHD